MEKHFQLNDQILDIYKQDRPILNKFIMTLKKLLRKINVGEEVTNLKRILNFCLNMQSVNDNGTDV